MAITYNHFLRTMGLSVALLTTACVSNTSVSEPKTQPTQPTPSKPQTTQKTIILDAVGDITPAEDYKTRYGRFDSFLNAYQSRVADILKVPFAKVKPYFDESYTIGNFESAALPDNVNPQEYLTPKEGRSFHFATSPRNIQVVSPQNSSVEALSLANNHSGDFGSLGKKTAIQLLKKQGNTPFGATLQPTYDEYKGVKIALIGTTHWHTTPVSKTKNDLQKAITTAKNNGAKIIVIFIHGAKEGYHDVQPYQRSLAHSAAEAGATLFVWSHQHVVSGTEIYRASDGHQAAIAYGLGNFMFGGNGNPADKNSFIFRNTFAVTSDNQIKLLRSENIPAVTHPAPANFQVTPASTAKKQEILDVISQYSPETLR